MAEGDRVHRELTRVPPAYPAWAVVLGAVSAAAGIALGTFGVTGAGRRGWLAILAGSLLLLVGLWLVARAVRARRWRRKAGGRTGPVWTRDWKWSPGVSRDTKLSRGPRVLGVGLLMVLFLAPFHVAVLGDDLPWRFRWFPAAFLLLLDLVALVVLASGVGLLFQRLRYGEPLVRYAGFPLFLGEQAVLEFAGGEALASGTQVRMELLALAEVEGARRGQPTHRVLWRRRWLVSTDAVGHARLRFNLPDDAPSTDLLAHPPVYWELEVSDDRPGVDYHGIFMLPVYGRPASVEEEMVH